MANCIVMEKWVGTVRGEVKGIWLTVLRWRNGFVRCIYCLCKIQMPQLNGKNLFLPFFSVSFILLFPSKTFGTVALAKSSS